MGVFHTFPTIVLLLIATFGIVGMAIVFLRWWAGRSSRQRAQRQAQHVKQLLGAMRMAVAALEARAAETEIAEHLLADVVTELNDCLSTLSHWHNTQPTLPASPLERLLALAWTYPIACRQHEQALRAIDQRVAHLQKQIGTAKRAIEQVRRQPSDISRRISRVQNIAEQAKQVALVFKQDGKQGDFATQAIAALDTHLEALELLSTPPAEPSPESLRSVGDHLAAVETNLLDLTRQMEAWQIAHSQLREKLEQIEVEYQSLDKAVAEGASFASAAVYRRETLSAQTNEIKQRLHSASAAELSDMSQTAEHILSELRSILQELMQQQSWQQEASSSIATARSKIDHLRESMQALSQAEQLAILWDDAESEWAQALAMVESIARAHEQNNLTERQEELSAVQGRVLSLEKQIGTAAHYRSRLMAALESPEIATRNQWVAGATAIQTAVSAYAPDNWPPRDSVVSLKSDIAILASMQTELEPIFNLQPVRESQIGLWLDRVNAYIRDRRALQTRLDHIAAQLQLIQNTERTWQATVSATLNLVARLPADVTQLEISPQAEAAWRELNTLWQQGKDVSDALGQRLVGQVSEKASAAEAWMRQCTESVHLLLTAIEQDCRASWEELRKQLARVKRLAPLNLEPSLIIANRLAEMPLSIAGADDNTPVDGPPMSGANLSLSLMERLVDQTVAALELHARLHRARREFERQVIGIIGSRPENVLAKRQAATAIWEALHSLRSRTAEFVILPLSWAEVNEIERAFTTAEDAWTELTRKGRTVKWVVSRLDSLIDQYSAICAHGERIRIRLESQAIQLRLAWDRIGLWRRRLQRYRDQHFNDRPLVAAINTRLQELESSLSKLRDIHADTPLPLDRARQEIDRILRESYRDIDVARGERMETVSAHAIAPVE